MSKNKDTAQAEAQAEALVKNNADTTAVEAQGANGDVFIFANMPKGITFPVKDGSVIINGMPVSALRGSGGEVLGVGKHGVTKIKADAWNYIKNTYGNMAVIKNGLMFAAESLERGKAMARERGGMAHGFEQINTESDKRVKSSAKTND